MPVKVLTNHKNLEYFITTKKLTPRQARWAEFLSKFNFVVTYQTGKKNDKADALTRRPNEQSASEEDEQQEHRMQMLLPPERIEIQLIEVTNKPKVTPAEPQPTEDSVKAKRNKEIKELERSHAAELHTEPHAEHKKSVETKDLSEELEDLLTLSD